MDTVLVIGRHFHVGGYEMEANLEESFLKQNNWSQLMEMAAPEVGADKS